MNALNFDRKELAAYILNSAKDSVVKEIKQLIQKEENIVAFTTDGTPLTENDYRKRIKKISRSIEKGAETYASEEVEDYVKNKAKRS